MFTLPIFHPSNLPVSLFLAILTLLLAAFVPPAQSTGAHKRLKTQARPALSGPVAAYSTEHFVIHYTLTGEDAVAETDEDSTGRPDYVEAVAEALEYAWRQQIEQQGWRAPLPDKAEGGDERLDVYLENQDTIYGYMDSFGSFVSDPGAEVARTAYGYLSIDNDYSSAEFEDELDPLEVMRTTVAHEFHHAVQSAYDDEDPHYWLYEATAVWMEDKLYPDIGDARTYLDDYLNAPDLCLLSVGRDSEDVRWYGSWLLLQYIAEHYGGPATIRQVWEQMITQDGLAALDATLTVQKTSLTETIVNFSVANLTKSTCPTNEPYCYAAGETYLRPYVEHSLRVKAGELKTLTPKDGVQQFGADYIRIRGQGPLRLAFAGSAAGQWHLRLVGWSEDKTSVTPVSPGSATTVDPSVFDKLYMVIVNTAPVNEEAACGYHNYTLALAGEDFTGNLTPPELPADPGPYMPPRLDDEAAYNSVADFGQPIAPEDLPFAPRYAGYLPAGYTFTELLSYVTNDFNDLAQDYAPQGEPIISVEYSHDSSGGYLSLVQSASPYKDVAAWVEARGYEGSYLRLVYNTPVYLVDYSDEAEVFSSATFVAGHRFIVIDGTIDPIEMQRVVAGLLRRSE